MTDTQFIPKSYSKNLDNGQVSWQSPSNIALVKYWGKYGEQLPKNASISFTLSNCNTKTSLRFKKKSTSESFTFQVFLDGKREESFEPKIQKFFERIEAYIPFLKAYQFTIETSNSFPHSSGIASSASGMSALALCLVSMEQQMSASENTKEYYSQKASFLARLGSGSACRSIEGDLIVWGKHPDIEGSSNLFGVKYPYTVHANFKNYQDTILLVDKGEKQVSSTVGHDLMHNHPFAEQRFEQANNNLSQLLPILESGDLSAFIKIVESEALSLHAMMMTSMPYFILMKPNTLEIINRIWEYRAKTKSNICFTLDAGANVHVLYPETEKETVALFIEKELSSFCKNGEFISDVAGFGAISI
ncbi:diphosphomevalonate/mevalonate 3,5-bisphosphate decarboxylase family protein [Ulvibacter litoralis]|uniref:Diphosphomevalonate decarboxylase n=1 Tax=Ulvibacter litoralis TaxID=227084 RepID=A0A1G7CKY0_9FLAO|nr:diphosphomevalonate decarboxylase [Ulvibacter litoralis]GHC47170.1 diphosphomevalonate decarboxylase [Ulvibacter litoralis]SDE39326.1 diphosphomevalonate decarboxylase [Ulvibacter litoralis]